MNPLTIAWQVDFESPDGPAWLRLGAGQQLLAGNAQASLILASSADVLRVRAGCLEAPHAGTAMRSFAERALNGQPAALALPRAGRNVLMLRCLPSVAEGGTEGVRVTLHDPDALRVDAALLQQLFKLTPAEARVASALAAGHSTGEIAAALGVQPNTVKAHVRHLMDKTGHQRQVQLVSLLLRSAAVLSSHAGSPTGSRGVSPNQAMTLPQ